MVANSVVSNSSWFTACLMLAGVEEDSKRFQDGEANKRTVQARIHEDNRQNRRWRNLLLNARGDVCGSVL